MSVVARLVGAVVFALVACPPALAFDTPEALVAALYAPYLADEIPEDGRAYFSVETQALWAALEARDPYGLGFDPVIDGQDFHITELAVSQPLALPNGVELRVGFRNFGEPRDLAYRLVEEAQGWRVDDIVAEGDPQWRLRALLGE